MHNELFWLLAHKNSGVQISSNWYIENSKNYLVVHNVQTWKAVHLSSSKIRVEQKMVLAMVGFEPLVI